MKPAPINFYSVSTPGMSKNKKARRLKGKYSWTVTVLGFPLLPWFTKNVAVLYLIFASFHNWSVSSLHNLLPYTASVFILCFLWQHTPEEKDQECPWGKGSRTPQNWREINHKPFWILHNRLENEKRNYPKRRKVEAFKKLLCILDMRGSMGAYSDLLKSKSCPTSRLSKASGQ